MEIVERGDKTPHFHPGQLVHHLEQDYVGVIVDVDPVYSRRPGTDEAVDRSEPPRDRPWYHVLVDGERKQRYVSEGHLEPVEDPEPIDHPWLKLFFDAFVEGGYVRTRPMN